MAAPKRWYSPAAISIKPTRTDWWRDLYTGTREELEAAGVVPQGMFPGDPGMPLAVVSIWPRGSAPTGGNRYRLPGRVSVSRLPSGKFTAAVNVSSAEQDRRAELEAAEDDRIHKEQKELHDLKLAEKVAGLSLDAIVERLGADVVRRRLRSATSGNHWRSASHLKLVWSAPSHWASLNTR